MGWFLYDNGLRHERVKLIFSLRQDGKSNLRLPLNFLRDLKFEADKNDYGSHLDKKKIETNSKFYSTCGHRT